MLENKRTEKRSTKVVFTGIDIFKVIAAALVVLLHSIETTDYFVCGIKFVFTRLAVPFFFIASGFFFCRGLDTAQDKKLYFLKYEKNLLKLFFIWGIFIYGPFTVSSYVSNNASVGIIKIIGLLIRRMLVIGSGPYWYLVALFWSTVFIYLCHVKKKEWILKVGIVAGLFLEIAYACFRGVLSEISLFKWLFDVIYFVYSWEFNFLMFGIPFAGIGYFLYKNKIRLNAGISAVILIAATMLRIIEYKLPDLIPNEVFWADNQISIAFIIQAIAFFMLAKELNFSISKEVSLSLRQWSSFVYFSHVIILYNILNPLLASNTSLPIYAPEFVAVKTIIVLMVCTIFFVVIKRIDNKYLNILING